MTATVSFGTPFTFSASTSEFPYSRSRPYEEPETATRTRPEYMVKPVRPVQVDERGLCVKCREFPDDCICVKRVEITTEEV